MDDRRRFEQHHQQQQGHRPSYGQPNRGTSSDRMQGGSRQTDAYPGYYEDTSSSFGNVPYQPTPYGDPSRAPYGPSMIYGGHPAVPYQSGQPFGSPRDQPPLNMLQGPSYFGPDSDVVYQHPSHMSQYGTTGEMPQPSSMLGSHQPQTGSGSSKAGGTSNDQSNTQDTPTTQPTLDEREILVRMDSWNEKLSKAMELYARRDLSAAADTLLELNSWLIANVVPLGIHLDDESKRSDRLQMWRNFNHMWLGVLQLQVSIFAKEEASGPSNLDLNQLKKMGNEFTNLCSNMEPHGLVDYEYGVWEDRVIELLENLVEVLLTDD